MAGGGQGAPAPQGNRPTQMPISQPSPMGAVNMPTTPSPASGGAPAFGDKYVQGMNQALNNMIAAGTITGIADASGRVSRPGDPGFPSPAGGAKAPTGYADGGAVQSGYNNFASPNQQGFMQYQGQGQYNQPQGQPNSPQSPLGMTPPAPPASGGPDSGAEYAPANMGFDGSGSDAGIGGQPAPMQSPLQQGNKPLGLAQFQQPQGLQIQGNPTSQVVQRPQQR